MERVRKYLKDFGFSEQDIDNILNKYPINNMLEETLIKHCISINNFLLENYYTNKEIIKIVISYPQIYGYIVDNLKQKIEDIMSLGYTKEEVIKMTKSFPTLYSLSIENIKQKIEDIISLGYTKEEVIKMTKSLPTLYSLSIENIKQKLEDIISLGYTKEEVIKMTKSFSTLYSLSIEIMKQKLEDIMSLGYTKEEVIKMTLLFPTLYGLTIENIKQKIDYLKEIELDFIILKDPRKLLQSVDLTYARHEFLSNQGKIINIENYNLLFYSNKNFAKQFKIEKKELLERYPYKSKEERRNVI